MAAPKGNKFAIGNEGTEKYFDSAEELQDFIDEYFEYCDGNPLLEQNWVGKEGVEVLKRTQRPYTIEGLCLHLHITRQTLLNYQKREGYEEYFDTITRAKRKITEQYVTFGLAGGYNTALVKFLLSNNTEYKDKAETELSGTVNLGVTVTKKEAKDISDALENDC